MKQQLILPCIPMGATEINNRVGVFRENDRCTYFLGSYPVFFHKADDNRMFRVVTSQLIESGGCRQVEILRTFGVSKSSVIRSVKKLRQGGVSTHVLKRCTDKVKWYRPRFELLFPNNCRKGFVRVLRRDLKLLKQVKC